VNEPTAHDVLNLLRQGRNVFLTGPGGVGKTYITNQVISMLDDYGFDPTRVAVTASTGVAALNLNGRTIHSFSGMGTQTNARYAETLRLKPNWNFTAGRLRHCQFVIIDECSMLRGDQFALLSKIFQNATKRLQPFGGIPLLLIGDFLQLTPVIKSGERVKHKWIFKTPEWHACEFEILNLTKVHRQTDEDFIKALHHLRMGECPDWVNELILSRTPSSGKRYLKPVRLYPCNCDVNMENRLELKKLPGPQRKYTGKGTGVHQGFIDTMAKTCLAGQVLHLRPGTQVMALNNDLEQRYVNGSTGRVVDFTEGQLPIVRLTDSGEEVVFNFHTWAMNDVNDKVLATYTQMPLKLSYAMTAHKAQGMTVDCAHVSCANSFAEGQIYVALSRVKSLDGLFVSGWNRKLLKADQQAVDFYRSFEG